MGKNRTHAVNSNIREALQLIALFGIIGAATSSANPDKSYSVVSPQLPLLFEQNLGQFNKSVDYVARGKGYSIALGTQPVIELYRFKTGSDHVISNTDERLQNRIEIEDAARIQLKIVGARQDIAATPLDKQKALTHYLIGESSDWRTDVPNFKRVRYSELLPGIDVEYYGRNGRLEYDFVVRPGSDPTAISLKFEGSEGLSINAGGDLLIDLGHQQIIQRRPVTYQSGPGGQRLDIESAYTLSNGTVGFQVAAWDRTMPLVIDPVIEYSRYYGGAGSDIVRAVDIDASGNIYVIGESASMGLATPGAFQSTAGERVELMRYPYCPDCTDGPDPGGQVERSHITRSSSILVTKFSPDGQSIIWSTYFNGSPKQSLSLGINSAAVSDTGEVAFGLGYSAADGLPLSGETQTWSPSEGNFYLAKLNSSGNDIVFATYLHVGDGFYLRGLDVSPSGDVGVTGGLGLGNSFPEVNSISGQSCELPLDQFDDYYEGFVASFSTSGTLTFSSCLGGELHDGTIAEALRGVAFGDNGNLYVVGYSSATDFPMVNPIQASKNVAGAREMTIAQIDPGTGTLVFSTWFGPTDLGIPPTGYDYDTPQRATTFFPVDIKTDSGGNIIVVGTIGSLKYPTINALQTNMAVPRDSTEFLYARYPEQIARPDDFFVTKLHPDNGVVFSTYLGGSRSEASIPSLALDSDDNIYIAGVTASDDYPVLNAIQSTIPSTNSFVLSKLTPAGALSMSTYLGGSSQLSNFPGGVGVNASGKIILGSYGDTDDFPIVGSGTSRSGSYDLTLSIIDQSGDTDTDGDRVPDTVDAFPDDDSEWKDTDGDETGDNADTDDDDDGEPDVSDRFPQDGTETADADEDGAGDNRDGFDADLANYFDFDDDGLADFDDTELDRDADGTENPDDAFDFDASETIDSDRDGVGDNADEDDDGDLTPDAQDPDSLDFDVPMYTFERYYAGDTNLFKSPWPAGFEGVDGADAAWTSAEDQSYSGDTSFSTRVIDHGQEAAIQHTDTYSGGYVRFWYKVDSQESFDLFTFSVDSTVLLTTSGDTGWQLFSTPINPGVHTLEWRFAKDGSVSVGDDAAWIDDFEIVATCKVNAASDVTEYSNASHEACETMIVGPSFIAANGSSVSISSGLEIDFLPGFLVEQGATLNANVCGQSLCATSTSPMPYGCHSCVSQICDIDAACCDTEFDQACLDKVDTECGLVCE
jgi:hypothetical protein